MHVGAAACNERALIKRVDEIAADPNAYVLLGGDQTNAIGRGDPRRQQSERAEWVGDADDVHQIEETRMIALIAPIATKIIGVVEGNHEAQVLRHDGYNIYRRHLIAIALECAKQGKDIRPQDLALGTEGFLRLRFRRRTPEMKTAGSISTVIFIQHGWGGGRRIGGKSNKLEDLVGRYDADMYLAGHTHEIDVFPKKTVAPAGVKKSPAGVIERVRFAVRCGTALNTYLPDDSDGYPVNTYGQRMGYLPTTTGWPVIELQPWHGKIKIIVEGETHGR